MVEIIDVTGTKTEEKKQHVKSRKHDFLLSAKNLYLNYPDFNLELITIEEQLKKNYPHTT